MHLVEEAPPGADYPDLHNDNLRLELQCLHDVLQRVALQENPSREGNDAHLQALWVTSSFSGAEIVEERFQAIPSPSNIS